MVKVVCLAVLFLPTCAQGGSRISADEDLDIIKSFSETANIACPETFDPSEALVRMRDRVQKYSSVEHLEISQRRTLAQGPLRTVHKRKLTLTANGRYRCDDEPDAANKQNRMTSIMDGEFFASYWHESDPPVVQIVPIGSAPDPPKSILDYVQKHRLDATHFVGCKQFRGVALAGYRMNLGDEKNRQQRTTELWLDLESLLPALAIEMSVATHHHKLRPRSGRGSKQPGDHNSVLVQNVYRVLLDFKWNVVVDANLFKIDLPQGWHILDLSHVEDALRMRIKERNTSGQGS